MSVSWAGMLFIRRGQLLKGGDTAAAMRRKAEFEQQLAAEYDFDRDEVWRAAVETADTGIKEANRRIEQRCHELGIPKRFHPFLDSVQRCSRGENLVRARRAELIRVFNSKNVEAEKQAKLEVDRVTLRIETELLTTALESAEAKAFLVTPDPPITERCFTLDREKLEREGCVRSREARKHFYAQPDYSLGSHVPECLQVFRLTLQSTVRELRCAFRQRVKTTHPDQGGEAHQFRQLREHYERALACFAANEA